MTAPVPDRLLIVNADDFGLTPGVCEGILRAHDVGVVTSTSALVVAPAFADHASRLADRGIGVGAHLCLVGEDPLLLGPRETPTLVDGAGRPARSWRHLAARLATGRIDLDDVRRELGAQLAALDAAGVRVTHVDSHQHVHQFPRLAEVVVAVAAERGIPAARVARSARRDPVSIVVRTLGRRFAAECGRAGIATPTAFAGLDGAGHLDADAWRSTMARLAASGASSAEVGCHPGIAEDPDRVRYRWDYAWAEELATLCDPATRRAVDEAGFTLGDYGDLAARAATDAAA